MKKRITSAFFVLLAGLSFEPGEARSCREIFDLLYSPAISRGTKDLAARLVNEVRAEIGSRHSGLDEVLSLEIDRTARAISQLAADFADRVSWERDNTYPWIRYLSVGGQIFVFDFGGVRHESRRSPEGIDYDVEIPTPSMPLPEFRSRMVERLIVLHQQAEQSRKLIRLLDPISSDERTEKLSRAVPSYSIEANWREVLKTGLMSVEPDAAGRVAEHYQSLSPAQKIEYIRNMISTRRGRIAGGRTPMLGFVPVHTDRSAYYQGKSRVIYNVEVPKSRLIYPDLHNTGFNSGETEVMVFLRIEPSWIKSIYVDGVLVYGTAPLGE